MSWLDHENTFKTKQEKTVDGLSPHKASGRYYSIGKDGQRAYWGRDKAVAIRDFRLSQVRRRNPPMTETEAVELLDEIGVDVSENSIELAKETRPGSFSPMEADAFVAANPNHRHEIVGKPRKPSVEHVGGARLTGHGNTQLSGLVRRSGRSTSPRVGTENAHGRD